jgi:hypothetical protein
MFFFCKPSKIAVDCFTTHESSFHLAPIDLAVKYFPDWWKRLPKSIMAPNPVTLELGTLKKCYGLIELYKSSLILPLWSDIVIEPKPDNVYWWQCADGQTEIHSHPYQQIGDAFRNYHHGKINSPWFLKEKSGIKFMLSPCQWSLLPVSNDLNLLSGISEFKYQHATNINFFLNLENKNRLLLEAGTPLYHIIPLSSKSITVKQHLLTTQEFDKMFGLQKSRAKFLGNYNFRKKILQQKKCPFTG